MAFVERLTKSSYFPAHQTQLPFGMLLNSLFFDPISDNQDYPIHGPNVVRFTKALFDCKLEEPGLLKGNAEIASGAYLRRFADLQRALGIDLGASGDHEEQSKVRDLLMTAALYHDLGKTIRRANHPQIGANLLRISSQDDQKALVDVLVYEGDRSPNARYNRFSLISSILQHHDKFGVVSTGEGGLPIFSDILYFTSNETTVDGVKKNISSVMLMNLADIAAVNTASKARKDQSIKLAKQIAEIRKDTKWSERTGEEDGALEELKQICRDPDSCLGLAVRKINNVIDDWWALMEAVEHPAVRGNRVGLKVQLLDLEKNPARAIKRILRLLQEASETSHVRSLLDFVSPTSVESVLVATLGAHQFQTFCEQFATVAKLDYGLNFFKAVVCACARRELRVDSQGSWNSLSDQERGAFEALSHETKSRVASRVTILFVRVLESLVGRYSGVLDVSSRNPRRFGFQLRDLTLDAKIRDTIINLLCIEEQKEPIALTWIADEVTIWSMD